MIYNLPEFRQLVLLGFERRNASNLGYQYRCPSFIGLSFTEFGKKFYDELVEILEITT